MKLIKYFCTLVHLIGLLIFSSDANACRFWAGIANQISEEVIVDQLLQLPNSLKHLGEEYSDGWSLGYISKNETFLTRSPQASHISDEYDESVRKFSQKKPQILYGHLRRASSGCVEDVANPHPFTMMKSDRKWYFGHNGGISKDLLIQLIGEDYLKDNQPKACTYDAPESWVDSELYFIYLMKHIEESAYDVTRGLKSALVELYQALEDQPKYLNFFLTDSLGLWAFRRGNTLFYSYHQDLGLSAISSTVPEPEIGTWKDVPQDTIVILDKNKGIEFLPIFP